MCLESDQLTTLQTIAALCHTSKSSVTRSIQVLSGIGFADYTRESNGTRISLAKSGPFAQLRFAPGHTSGVSIHYKAIASKLKPRASALARECVDTPEVLSDLPSQPKKSESREWLARADALRGVITAANPASKLTHPNGWAKKRAPWARELRLLHQSDKVPTEAIDQAIAWVGGDDFWSGVIQSASGLRRNWDKVSAQMLRAARPRPVNGRAVHAAPTLPREFTGWENE